MSASGGLFGVQASVDAVARGAGRQAGRAPAGLPAGRAEADADRQPRVYVEGVTRAPRRDRRAKWRATGCRSGRACAERRRSARSARSWTGWREQRFQQTVCLHEALLDRGRAAGGGAAWTITGRPSRGLIVGIWRICELEVVGQREREAREQERGDRADLELAEAHPDARARAAAEGDVGALRERGLGLGREALGAELDPARGRRRAGGGRPRRSS